MVAMTTSQSAVVTLPTDTQIKVTREFAAPAHLVYRAWTEPELIARWWHAKRGEIKSVDVDLRVGGKWRWVMIAAGGYEVAFHGEYRELVPGERLVYTEVFEARPQRRRCGGQHHHVHRARRPHDDDLDHRDAEPRAP